MQAGLVSSRPRQFFVPPYVDHRGWLGIWLDEPVDWEEIAGLIIDPYREIAPRQLAA